MTSAEHSLGEYSPTGMILIQVVMNQWPVNPLSVTADKIRTARTAGSLFNHRVAVRSRGGV